MTRMTSAPVAALALALVGLCYASTAQAQEKWGNIKGQVVWGGATLPKNEKANIDKDQKHCLSKGDILKNTYVIDSKSKGVRWVMVWLTDPKDAGNAKWKPSAIHPSIKVPKEIVVDQPCCVFEPRVMGIVAGETNLAVKNSGDVPHNFAITSIGDGPSVNPLMPPKCPPVIVKGFVPKVFPTPYSCSIHSWMKGYIGTFAHPYFVVTDAEGNFELKNVPVGKTRVMLWHETGWVINAPKKENRGKVVSVDAGKTLDLGQIKLMPSE